LPDSQKWVRLSSRKIPPRASHSAVGVGPLVVFFGGENKKLAPKPTHHNDVWIYFAGNPLTHPPPLLSVSHSRR
jgi:hypothetical protein